MGVWHTIGIMSGTSADGMDAVLIRQSGDDIDLLHHSSQPFPEPLRNSILSLNQPQPDEINHLGHCARQLGRAYGNLVKLVLKASGFPQQDLDLIACHGQTIRHQPSDKDAFTLQIGWADDIVESTGITTVADFRPRDIAAGGQGAPLVPPFHAALFQADRARIILNIGGMANLSWIPPRGSSESPIAFDTGPGNVLLDALARQISQGTSHYDANGEIARLGMVNRELLDSCLREDYFHEQPPKSTGRELFGEPYVERIRTNWQGSDADLMATLVELSAESIARAIRQWTPGASEILIFGGGAENPVLVQALQKALPDTQVLRGETSTGIPSQALEAMAFAWLGLRSVMGLPGNLPAATGARRAVPLGAIHPGSNWPRLLRKLTDSFS